MPVHNGCVTHIDIFNRHISVQYIEYLLLDKYEKEYINGTADRILKFMGGLNSTLEGYKITRLEHSLQTATRAFYDKANEEMIVAALLHDIGDTLGPSNHADIAATILEPYVSEENHWIVKHHGIFQGYYFFHFLGLDKNMRDKYIDSPYFESCREFCEKYDQNSFDPEYDSLDLDFFIPMVKDLFKKPKKSIYLQS